MGPEHPGLHDPLQPIRSRLVAGELLASDVVVSTARRISVFAPAVTVDSRSTRCHRGSTRPACSRTTRRGPALAS